MNNGSLRILVTDCGSTTTKAVLFEKNEEGWQVKCRGEAPTTVEEPLADVTIGAKNAFLEIQQILSQKIVKDNYQGIQSPLISPQKNNQGVDLYLSTSSAGGGLQMVVAGIVGNMSSESAQRAALGGGAIVMDTISIDDGRVEHERVEKIRHLRPDIILIAGGVEGGNIEHPLELASIVLQADPKPRFGDTLKIPVIFAANSEVKEQAKNMLENKFSFTAVKNLRPSLEEENLAPTRDAIHEIFLKHVMSHAPGYKKLLSWSPKPVIPTPVGVGNMITLASKSTGKSILAVDIGGATTDIFSSIKNEEGDFRFNRSVSANLGMSYSISNVLAQAGDENILRWCKEELSHQELHNRLNNKMIRPTSIPQTKEDLELEHAVCREALRLSLNHHKKLASGLKGSKSKFALGQIFSSQKDDSGFEMSKLDLIIGSGGVLSHAPQRIQATQMLIDGFRPEGVTEIAVDSIFMMPHLGVMAESNKSAAEEIFFKECLVSLAYHVRPVGLHSRSPSKLLKVTIAGKSTVYKKGQFEIIPPQGEADISLDSSNLSFGEDKGKSIKLDLGKMKIGLVIDLRV